MTKRDDITGRRFGRLVALEFHSHKNASFWLMRCDCGVTKPVNVTLLKHGKARSCGCLKSEMVSARCRVGTLAKDGFKVCARCRTNKPVSSYTVRTAEADGLEYTCDTCVRDSQLRKAYGITLEAYRTMFESQGGCCLSCASPLTEVNSNRGAHPVDHDHTTGNIRGILCNGCNTALGQIKEDPARLEKLLRYCLTRCKKQTQHRSG